MTCRCCSLPGIPLAPGTPPPQQRAGSGERPEWDGLSLGSRIGRAAKANSFLPGSPGLSALPPPHPNLSQRRAEEPKLPPRPQDALPRTDEIFSRRCQEGADPRKRAGGLFIARKHVQPSQPCSRSLPAPWLQDCPSIGCSINPPQPTCCSGSASLQRKHGSHNPSSPSFSQDKHTFQHNVSSNPCSHLQLQLHLLT